ncbi:MAG: hypothetical protein HC828_17995, partial [Blastochloris sp.]|nr:hypothetical protein [Blastochloris sp.]
MSNVDDSSASYTNVIIAGNMAVTGNGGGIFNLNSSADFSATQIRLNKSNSSGGGVSNIENSVVSFTDVIISENSAVNGGGIHNEQSSPVFLSTSIISNTAETNGGGIFNTTLSHASYTNVTFAGNRVTTGNGGGVSNLNSNPIFTNVAFIGNRAVAGNGGGAWNSGGTPDYINVTIAGNAAVEGGGIFNASGSPHMVNSVIWGNTSQITTTSGTPTYGYNLIQDVNLGGTNLDGTDPMMLPLFANALSADEAPTSAGDYRILPGSALINAGITAVNAVETDLNGNPRIVPAVIDIGAYEAQGFALAFGSGNNQRTFINTPFSSPLAVTVTSLLADEPVTGGRVQFIAPETGASSIPAAAHATIGSDNTASISLSANSTTGSYLVTASTTGSSDTPSFMLTNITTATVTSFARTSTELTNAPLITWAITFTEPVDGLDASNIYLVSTGTATGTLSSVSGSGTVWTVTATDVSGDGTLSAVLANDIGTLSPIDDLPQVSASYTIDTTAPAIGIGDPVPTSTVS